MATLVVKVLEGKNLVACDRSGTSDPYVSVKFGTEKQKTKVVKETLSPSWEAVFNFPFDLHNPPSDVVFDIFDWNRILSHKRMGRATVPFREITASDEVYDKWLPLGKAKDEDVSGEIHVCINIQKRKETWSKGSVMPILTEEEEHPLFTAIKTLDLNKIIELVRDPKVDINMQDNLGFTPLHAAAVLFSENDDKIISELLHHKDIDVNIQNDDKNSPLHYFAAKFRSPTCTEIFELFIKKGANVNLQNSLGETPLHKAIFNNSVRLLMVDLLIQHKADVNKVNKHGETPLHYASQLDREDVALSLIKGGADINLKAEVKTSKGLANVTALELSKEVTPGGKMVSLLTSVQELYDWLDSIEMSKYKINFIAAGIFKEKLSTLSEQDLDSMQVLKTGERLKILKAIKSLNTSQPKPEVETNKKENNEETPTKQAPETTPAPQEKKPATLEEELDHMKYVSKKKSDWRIPMSSLEYTVKLGSGTSGTVYKGIYEGINVAIKLLKTSTKEIEEFKKEFHIMNAIQSPYLVFFFGACLEPKMCMVMELMSRGSLYHVISDPKFDCHWDRVFSFSREMLLGVDALHSWEPQVVHRDLKSLNLMVNEEYHVKVGDFGLSRFNTETQGATLNKMVGTMAYCAPEVYFGEKFSTKSDVYSAGVILWELINTCIKRKYERPYQEFPQLRFDFQIIIQVAKKGTRPTIPATCPESWKKLIQSAWHEHADQRPSCKDMLKILEEIQKDYEANKEEWESLRDSPLSVSQSSEQTQE